jgi:predicted nucleic acid-binding protein
MENYENFQQTPEERTDFEKMIRQDRKNELRKLTLNKHLYQETYCLINKQFEKEISQHLPKNIAERHFNNKPDDCPRVLMINEPVYCKEL